MRIKRFLATALVAALPALVAAQQLTISAAASLINAFKEIGSKFEAVKPGVTLRFNFAASGVLIQQITQGAPVDVFASADETSVTRGIEQKLFDAATKRDFARNTVVLVVPAQRGANIRTLADLGSVGVKRIAIGKTATTPVGRYTKESLDAARLWSALEPKFVFADTVRQVLDYVARGEVDAGFLYRTDALIGGDKVNIALTAEGHTPVSYPVVMVSESRNKALARDFIAFLSTPPALEVLAKHGFGRP
jgi:molybdate transport system substrate-binding protein